MVTIIHLSAAPNRWVGPQQFLQKAIFDTFSSEGGWGSKNPYLGKFLNFPQLCFGLGDPSYKALLLCVHN